MFHGSLFAVFCLREDQDADCLSGFMIRFDAVFNTGFHRRNRRMLIEMTRGETKKGQLSIFNRHSFIFFPSVVLNMWSFYENVPKEDIYFQF